MTNAILPLDTKVNKQDKVCKQKELNDKCHSSSDGFHEQNQNQQPYDATNSKQSNSELYQINLQRSFNTFVKGRKASHCF